jgi:hypothetical protein
MTAYRALLISGKFMAVVWGSLTGSGGVGSHAPGQMEKWRLSLGKHSLINASGVIRTALPLRHSTRGRMTSPMFHVASAVNMFAGWSAGLTVPAPGSLSRIECASSRDDDPSDRVAVRRKIRMSALHRFRAGVRPVSKRQPYSCQAIPLADGVRAEQCWPGGISGLRRCSGGSGAHHHIGGHRIPAAARRACPRGPACMRQKRIRDQPPGCGPAPTTEAQAPAADSPGREPDHGASR